MPPQRQVYLLKPQELPPETIAVTFAKTSRSPESFSQIAAELTDQKSAQFHEKWVVGYGHSSVAEHAVLHIAVENISRLAIETVESNRLASFTEKSTRYQKWEQDSFYTPSEIKNHPLVSLYQQTCRHLLTTYAQALNIIKDQVTKEMPRHEDEKDSDWERRLRSEYIDVCRYLLPAASLANVGITINARALEHMLCKMLSSPLEEVQTLGEEIKKVSLAEVPTLVKYANPSPYMINTHNSFASKYPVKTKGSQREEDWCTLVSYDSQNEERILAAVLYRFGNRSYADTLTTVRELSAQERQNIAQKMLGSLEDHDIPLRELEHSSYTFDIILDQGAYFELKRHRMMTQTPQPLTAELGYSIPRWVLSAGFEKEYQRAMDMSKETYYRLAEYNPYIASYIVPNAFKRRVLLTMNLRAAFHLIALRTAPNAHFAMRRIAQRMAEEIQRATPLLATYIKRYTSETWQNIQNQYFHQI